MGEIKARDCRGVAAFNKIVLRFYQNYVIDECINKR